jgi:hypothetical protein
MRIGSRCIRHYGLLGALLLASACTELVEPVVPNDDGGELEVPVGADSTGTPIYLKAVTCTVTVEPAKATCAPVDTVPAAASGQSQVILGGQGRYISLDVSGEAYNPGTQTFSLNVSVRNLIGQALGTIDGSTPSGLGTRVFLANGPIALSGTGTVYVQSPDGTGNFTAANQPYYQYNGVVQPYQVVGPRTWSFSMPSTVTSYTFTAYVSTPVQHPDGWISIGGYPEPMVPRVPWRLIATRRDVVGEPLGSAGMVWTTADSTVAQVAADGTVTGLRAGTVTISAAKSGLTGTTSMDVSGITRVWTGASSTDFSNRANWAFGVAPVVQDSILIPTGLVTYPTLVANAQVTGVTVEQNANINVGAFDLTATGDVTTSTLGGGILGTTGRVFLSGIAKNVGGVLPRVRVTGTYTMISNLTTTASFEVTSGRITNSSFRLQANP